MTGQESATPEERALLSRYAAFLDTDLPYEWPESNFIRMSGLGALVPLSLGLLGPADRWIRKRNAKFDAMMDAHGDLSVWPFTDRSLCHAEPLEPYDR